MWAIGMQHNRATNPTAGDNSPFIYKKGPAFGMPGILVDGMDVRKVTQQVLQNCNVFLLAPWHATWCVHTLPSNCYTATQ